MHTLIILCLITLPAVAMSPNAIIIKSSAIQAPVRLGKISLIYQDNNFFIEKDNIMNLVQKAFMSPTLRSIGKKQLSAFQNNHCYIKINQLDNEEYTLQDAVKSGSTI